MYMHVYACICMYVAASILDLWTNSLQVRICTYTYMIVFVCICRICTYVYSYMHVFPGMTPSDTRTEATSPKHSLSGRQSAGHTQGTTEHLSIHFFSALGQCLADPNWCTPPRCAPEASLSFRTEVSNARSAHYKPVPLPITADLVGWNPSSCPGRRPPILGNTSRQ